MCISLWVTTLFSLYDIISTGDSKMNPILKSEEMLLILSFVMKKIWTSKVSVFQGEEEGQNKTNKETQAMGKYRKDKLSCLVSFWLHTVACGILVPQPGIKPVTPAVEAQILNHWTTREISQMSFFIIALGYY